MEDYVVRDGDIILTIDGFIFYAVGYDHPKNKAISYLKYIPQVLKEKFPLDFIKNIWYHEKIPYIRPKKLYSPENFKKILNSFKEFFPSYLHSSNTIQKEIFVVPTDKIKRVFVPKEGLQELIQKKNKDKLEEFALDLIHFLSEKSNIPLKQFGLHGSLLTGMHSEQSDVDIGVYNHLNYNKLKDAIKKLVENKEVNYLFEIESDTWRFNKCEYRGKKFVFNAIRDLNQVKNAYNYTQYEPQSVIKGTAVITDISEAAYRPALYKIKEVEGKFDELIPSQVVSMIGEYRDIVRVGQRIEFRGLLEKVIDKRSNSEYSRIFIGSENEGEYVKPII
ncbi:MAG: hypothetical protein EAX96_18950 [Candidatus Lokiarchaeota archaeon]|nr:hypothetical protein [Candidatus Lokiarchaeota archaeon]